MSLRLEPLERVEAPSMADFWGIHVRRRKPVIFAGLAGSWPAVSEWSLPWFIQNYGTCTWPFISASLERGPVFGTAVVAEFLPRVLEQQTSDLMMVPFSQLPTRLSAQAPPFRWFEKTATARQTLFINRRGGQSALHFDKTNNLITQIHGTKELRMFPLHRVKQLGFRGVFSSMPNFATWSPWKGAPPPGAAPVHGFEGVLNPGDTVYVPLGWWHSLRARDPSITSELSWETGWERALFAVGETYKRVRGLHY